MMLLVRFMKTGVKHLAAITDPCMLFCQLKFINTLFVNSTKTQPLLRINYFTSTSRGYSYFNVIE